MQVLTSTKELSQRLEPARMNGKRIGFVPTMGALHEGHLSLIKFALEKTDQVVLSIFVNPTQFNNPSDLANYPRMLEADLQMLVNLPEVLVFHPSVNEVYPEDDSFLPIDLNGMDKVMEGQFRPGHFEGVVHVVNNLFRMVEPTDAFFGLKDFQQLAIIRHMTSILQLPTVIHACPTIRNHDGLALSSRNMLLSNEQQNEALILSQTLEFVRKNKDNFSPEELRALAVEHFQSGSLKLEYLEMVDASTLKPLTDFWTQASVCCIAAYCGQVRLIDNMILQ